MSRLGMFTTGLFILSAIACGSKQAPPQRKEAPPPAKAEPKAAQAADADGARPNG